MRAFLQNRWLILVLRLALGGVFLVASVAKLQNVSEFITIVSSYVILPDSLAHVYGYVAPWVELFIGCSLILGVFVRFSSVLCILLIISFMIAGIYAISHVVGINCGCFGKILTLSHQMSLTIDVLMLFASLILLFGRGKEFFSIGQLIDKIHIKSRNLNIGFRLGVVIVTAAAVWLIAIGAHSFTNKAGEVIQTINIPVPLANDVDSVLLEKKSVVLEFYADDCIACKEAEPTIIELERKYAGKTIFIPLDYYQNPQVVSDMSITTTPTILVIVSKNTDGKYVVLCRFERVIEKADLQACLEKALKNQ